MLIDADLFLHQADCMGWYGERAFVSYPGKPAGLYRLDPPICVPRMLHVGFDHLSSSLIAAARRHGIDVRTYTINDPVAAAPFRDAGLTGVITDHPPYFLDDPDWRAWAQT